MARTKTPDAHKMILFVQKTPFEAGEKDRLVNLLSSDGLTDETVQQVRQAVASIPKEHFVDEWQHGKLIMELNNLLKQWQLSYGSKNFKHTR